jgi:hypothetical protein
MAQENQSTSSIRSAESREASPPATRANIGVRSSSNAASACIVRLFFASRLPCLVERVALVRAQIGFSCDLPNFNSDDVNRSLSRRRKTRVLSARKIVDDVKRFTRCMA